MLLLATKMEEEDALIFGKGDSTSEYIVTITDGHHHKNKPQVVTHRSFPECVSLSAHLNIMCVI